MCKLNPKNNSRRIDPCLRRFINNLDIMLPKNVTTISSCCGHGKYHMTMIIIIKDKHRGNFIMMDLISGFIFKDKTMNRKSIKSKLWNMKLYKRDKQGYYFIPEVEEYYKNIIKKESSLKNE